MNILILEDDPNRIGAFARALETGNTVTVTDQVSEAIALLQSQRFDAVYLDHDLGGKQFVDPKDEPTGYHVAQWLVENSEYIPSVVFIHSHNAGRARQMAEMIPGSIYAPFPKCITDYRLIKDE